MINADGSGLRRLTRNAVADSEPAWSPDGQKIVWSRSDGTGADVFVMNADGSDQQNLTLKPGNQGEPRWSPNGRAILFTAVSPMQPSRGSRPYRDVYVMNADGSGQRNLTHTPEAGEFDPAWSPDGHQIAFTRLAGPPGEVTIVVMNADGSAKHAVTPMLAHPGDRAPAALWSPDGRRIAFWRRLRHLRRQRRRKRTAASHAQRVRGSDLVARRAETPLRPRPPPEEPAHLAGGRPLGDERRRNRAAEPHAPHPDGRGRPCSHLGALAKRQG